MIIPLGENQGALVFWYDDEGNLCIEAVAHDDGMVVIGESIIAELGGKEDVFDFCSDDEN